MRELVAASYGDEFLERLTREGSPDDLMTLRHHWSVYRVLAEFHRERDNSRLGKFRQQLDKRTTQQLEALLRKTHVTPAFQLFEFAVLSGWRPQVPFDQLLSRHAQPIRKPKTPGLALFERQVAELVSGNQPTTPFESLDNLWKLRARSISVAISDARCSHHQAALDNALSSSTRLGHDSTAKFTLVGCEKGGPESQNGKYLAGRLETADGVFPQRFVLRADLSKMDSPVALRQLIQRVRSVLEQDQVAQHQLKARFKSGEPAEYLLALSASAFAPLTPLEKKMSSSHGLTPREVERVMVGDLQPWKPLLEEQRWALLLSPVRVQRDFPWEVYDLSEAEIEGFSPKGWYELRRTFLGHSKDPRAPRLRWQLPVPAERCLEEVQVRFPQSGAAVDALLARNLTWRELTRMKEVAPTPALEEAADWRRARSLPSHTARVAALKEHAERYGLGKGRFAVRAQLLAARLEQQAGMHQQAIDTLDGVTKHLGGSTVDEGHRALALLMQARLLNRELRDFDASRRNLNVVLNDFAHTKYAEAARWELALIANQANPSDDCEEIRAITKRLSTTSPYLPCLQALCTHRGAELDSSCDADRSLGLDSAP